MQYRRIENNGDLRAKPKVLESGALSCALLPPQAKTWSTEIAVGGYNLPLTHTIDDRREGYIFEHFITSETDDYRMSIVACRFTPENSLTRMCIAGSSEGVNIYSLSVDPKSPEGGLKGWRVHFTLGYSEDEKLPEYFIGGVGLHLLRSNSPLEALRWATHKAVELDIPWVPEAPEIIIADRNNHIALPAVSDEIKYPGTKRAGVNKSRSSQPHIADVLTEKISRNSFLERWFTVIGLELPPLTMMIQDGFSHEIRNPEFELDKLRSPDYVSSAKRSSNNALLGMVLAPKRGGW